MSVYTYCSLKQKQWHMIIPYNIILAGMVHTAPYWQK